MTLNVEFGESQINKIMHFRLVIRNRQSDDMTIIGKSKMHNQKRLFSPKITLKSAEELKMNYL